MGMKLPQYFKIKENPHHPLIFHYYDEREINNLSEGFTNLQSLIKDCNKYASDKDKISKMELPEDFKIVYSIFDSFPKLYFKNDLIKSGDLQELYSIAIKNHTVYRQVNDLNDGKEVEL